MSDFMRNYEVTFIVDPVLSADEIKKTAQTYIDQLEQEGCKITHVDEMSLRTLAYPIKKKNSGIYYCVEFESINGVMIDKIELALRRDERILRFLTVALDKFGVKYNDDKRNGKIGKVVVKKKEEKEEKDNRRGRKNHKDSKPRPAAKKEAPAKVAPAKEEVKSETPAKEEVKPEVVAETPAVVEAPAVAETPATPTPEAPETTETTEKDA